MKIYCLYRWTSNKLLGFLQQYDLNIFISFYFEVTFHLQFVLVNLHHQITKGNSNYTLNTCFNHYFFLHLFYRILFFRNFYELVESSVRVLNSRNELVHFCHLDKTMSYYILYSISTCRSTVLLVCNFCKFSHCLFLDGLK